MFRFGIMGAGEIAGKFCDAVKMVEGAEVSAVASKDQKRAEGFAQKKGIRNAYGNYNEMLESEHLDAVYIATTNNFHFENIMLCIQKHTPVLCEKSMFIDLKQAEEAICYARNEQVFLMEAMWSRFIPCIKKAREWIEQGRIGTIQLADYMGGIRAGEEHRIFDSRLGGGAMYDLTVYPIEILMYLINQPIKNVYGDIKWGNTNVDESDNLIIHFETCAASIQTTVKSRIPSPCGIYGTEGYIRLEQTHRAPSVELYNTKFELVDRYDHPIENGFEYEIKEVISCVRTGKLESDIMPLKDTLKCVWIYDQLLLKR